MSRVASPPAHPPAEAVRPSGLGLDRRDAMAVAVLAIGFLLPLRGLMRLQGPPMEEGFMLVFPEQLLRGELPNRDFLHLYGPGSIWALAGAFKVFGVSLVTERLFALAQIVGIVAGMYLIVRYWGRTLAAISGVLTLVIIITPIGLTALAWNGAVAFGLLGLFAGLEAVRAGDDRSRRRWALAAGLLAGAALLFRPDLVLAITLGYGAVILSLGAAARKRMLVGAAIGVAPYLIHLATAGVGNSIRGMVLDPVFHLRGGRRLPIPPSTDQFDGFLQKAGGIHLLDWPIPSLPNPAEITAWFFLFLSGTAFLVAVAVWRFRADRSSFRSRAFLVAALFALGLSPQALQRADTAHLAWVTCVTFGFLPVAVSEVVRVGAPRIGRRAREVVAGGTVFAVVFLLIPIFTFGNYVDYTLQSVGRHRVAERIEHRGRVFYYGRADVAAAVRELLPAADRVAFEGARLFVGPTDLRQTPYSDAYLYYLLPQTVPGTYYIEMDPGVADKPGSRLAEDLASSDLVILSAVWNDWDEPNDSKKLGSDVPNQVLRRDFELVGEFGGLYQLWARKVPRQR